MDLGFEIQKINIGTRLRNLEITCFPILGKTNNLDFFGPNLPEKEIRIWNSEK